MLSESSRKELRVADVRARFDDAGEELRAQAKGITDPAASVRATARFEDGATLELEDGSFKLAFTDALPAGGRSPVEALEQLRRVLARPSYAGLMRVLSGSTRAAITKELRGLAEALSEPDKLEIETSSERASVRLEGGRVIKLRREQGLWRVEGFD